MPPQEAEVKHTSASIHELSIPARLYATLGIRDILRLNRMLTDMLAFMEQIGVGAAVA